MTADWIPPAGALPVIFAGTCPRCGRPERILTWHRLVLERQVVVARCMDAAGCAKVRDRKVERARRAAEPMAEA